MKLVTGLRSKKNADNYIKMLITEVCNRRGVEFTDPGKAAIWVEWRHNSYTYPVRTLKKPVIDIHCSGLWWQMMRKVNLFDYPYNPYLHGAP